MMMVHLMLLLVLDANDRYPAITTNAPIAHPFCCRLLKHKLMCELTKIATLPMIKTFASGSTYYTGLVGVN